MQFMQKLWKQSTMVTQSFNVYLQIWQLIASETDIYYVCFTKFYLGYYSFGIIISLF